MMQHRMLRIKRVYLLIWIAIFIVFLITKPTLGKSIPKQSIKELSLFFTQQELKVTTATLSPKTITRAPALVTVINSKQIQEMGATKLTDVLARLPGFAVFINKIGNPSITVRGLKTYGEKILLMIDGHPVNSIDSGSAAWTFTDMPLDNVERIEIIRGPGSALYGENAFLAVINVITKKYQPQNKDYILNPTYNHKPYNRFLKFGYGSFDTKKCTLFTGKRGYNWAITLFVNLYKTKGLSAWVKQDALSIQPSLAQYSITPAKTQDWKEQQDIQIEGQYKDVGLNLRFLHKRQGPFIGVTDIMTKGSKRNYIYLFSILSFHHRFSNNIKIEQKFAIDYYSFKELWKGYPDGFLGLSEFKNGVWGEPKGKFRSFSLNFILKFPSWHKNKFTIGCSSIWKRAYDIKYKANFSYSYGGLPVPLPGGFQDVSDTSNWLSKSKIHTSDWGIFLQDDWQITKNLSMILGVRHDYFDTFGDTTNPRIGIVWTFSKQASFKLLYGQAFRAPSYNELYMANNPAIIGNPKLKPEKVATTEAGISFNLKKIFVNFDVFYSKFKDLIVPSNRQNQIGAFAIENSGRAKVYGTELSVIYKWNNLIFKANYSYQYSKDETFGGRFPFTPSQMANIITDIHLPYQLHINMRLFLCGKRYRKPTDPRKPDPAYALVDLSLLKKDFLSNNTWIQCIIHNLLNKKYTDAAPVDIPKDFPRPGRTVFLVFGYNF